MDLFKVESLENAINIAKSIKINRKTERVSLIEALDREVAEDLYSNENIPYFRKSTVDGYALFADEIEGSGNGASVILEIQDIISIGTNANDLKSKSMCSYIPTGGMVPKNATAIIKIEDTEKISENEIIPLKDVKINENIIDIGEDIKREDIIVKKGEILSPYGVGALSSVGKSTVLVYSKIKVGVISTGDEIINVNSKQENGKIRDINRNLLIALIGKDGAVGFDFGIAKDDLEEIKSAIEKAIKEMDFVIISGGTSVGIKDFTIKAIESFKDGEIFTHGISIKPGKPTIIGKVFGKPIFGFPGNPLAAVSIYHSIIVPILNPNKKIEMIEGEMAENHHSAKGRTEFLPVTIVNEYNKKNVYPILSKSNVISPMIKADGYILIDRDKEGLLKNEKVNVFLI